MGRNYQEYIARGKREHGDKFSESALAHKFINAYESQERITVAFVGLNGEVYEIARGTVGATTGWKPCFLLMATSRSMGSSRTLSERDRIVSMNEWREWRKANAA